MALTASTKRPREDCNMQKNPQNVGKGKRCKKKKKGEKKEHLQRPRCELGTELPKHEAE